MDFDASLQSARRIVRLAQVAYDRRTLSKPARDLVHGVPMGTVGSQMVTGIDGSVARHPDLHGKAGEQLGGGQKLVAHTSSLPHQSAWLNHPMAPTIHAPPVNTQGFLQDDQVMTPEGLGWIQEINPAESPALPIHVQHQDYDDWYHPNELYHHTGAQDQWPADASQWRINIGTYPTDYIRDWMLSHYPNTPMQAVQGYGGWGNEPENSTGLHLYATPTDQAQQIVEHFGYAHPHEQAFAVEPFGHQIFLHDNPHHQPVPQQGRWDYNENQLPLGDAGGVAWERRPLARKSPPNARPIVSRFGPRSLKQAAVPEVQVPEVAPAPRREGMPLSAPNAFAFKPVRTKTFGFHANDSTTAVKQIKRADNYTQDSREWPDPTEPRASKPPEPMGCTCHTMDSNAKLQCPIHGMTADPLAQELDHTWSLPQAQPVGEFSDLPRTWTQAVSAITMQPTWLGGPKGGDYNGYLNFFRQQALPDLIEYQRNLPEYGGGWPRSNHAMALNRVIQEMQSQAAGSSQGTQTQPTSHRRSSQTSQGRSTEETHQETPREIRFAPRLYQGRQRSALDRQRRTGDLSRFNSSPVRDSGHQAAKVGRDLIKVEKRLGFVPFQHRRPLHQALQDDAQGVDRGNKNLTSFFGHKSHPFRPHGSQHDDRTYQASHQVHRQPDVFGHQSKPQTDTHPSDEVRNVKHVHYPSVPWSFGYAL